MPHVHIHVLPRRPGDFEKNDEIYDELDRAEAHLPRCVCWLCVRLHCLLPHVVCLMVCCQPTLRQHKRVFLQRANHVRMLPACLLVVALSAVDGARLSERLQEGKGEGGSDNKLDLDKDRVVRTRQEMAAEAAELRKLFS